MFTRKTTFKNKYVYSVPTLIRNSVPAHAPINTCAQPNPTHPFFMLRPGNPDTETVEKR